MVLYSEKAPSGIEVTSTVPFVEPRWWDKAALHFVWSYSSWASMIADAYGWKAPRRLFAKHMMRRDHSK